MTNAQALDELTRLSSPAEAQKAEDENKRRNRSPLRYFKADILGNPQDLQIEQRTMPSWTERGVWLDLKVVEVYHSDPPIEDMSQRLWIRYPDPRKDGKPSNADLNSEPVLMMKSAGLEGIRSLVGKKGVVFNEDAHHFERDQRTDKPKLDNEGKPIPGQFIYEHRAFTTFYYKLDLTGAGGNSNGHTAPAAAPSEEASAKALSLIIEAGEEGIDEADFKAACIKDKLINKDKALLDQLMDVADPWVQGQVEAGKVLREGEKLVLTGG